MAECTWIDGWSLMKRMGLHKKRNSPHGSVGIVQVRSPLRAIEIRKASEMQNE